MKSRNTLMAAALVALPIVSFASNTDWRNNGTLSFFFDAVQPSGWVTGQDLFSQYCEPAKNQGAWTELKTGGNQYTFTVHQLWSYDQQSSYTTNGKATQIGQAWGANGATRWAHFRVRWIKKKDYYQAPYGWFHFNKPTSDIVIRVKHELQFKSKLALSHYVRDPGQSSTNCWAWEESWGEAYFQQDQGYLYGPPRGTVNHLFLGGEPSSVTKLTANKTFGPTTLGWGVWQVKDSNNVWKPYSELVVHASNVTLVGTTSDGRDVYEADIPSRTISLFTFQAVHLEHAKGHFDIDTTASGRVTLSYP